MTILLATLLLILGLMLWLVAGLLPVVKLRGSDSTVDLTVQTTWMGALRLNQRDIPNVGDARFTQDPNSRFGGQIQIKCDGPWQPLNVEFAPEAAMKAQLAEIIHRFVSQGGPPVLTLPMRGRMNLMIGFAIFFPLGTVSIFAAALLLTNAF